MDVWVKEDPEKIPGYTMGSGGTWRKTVSDAGTEMMLTPTPLTNTLYTNTSFTKAWQDEDGTPIAEDYLGFDLTVTFKLQVKPDGSTWQDASNYFTEDGCGLEELVLTSIKNAIRTTGFTKNPDDPFKATLTGRIDSTVWGGTNRFNNLPTVIRPASGDTVKLTYRVVEESVAYGRQSQTITFENDASYKKAEPTPSAEPTPTSEPTPTAAPTPTAEPTPTPKPEESDAVQTGDETDLTVPSMLFLMSVSGLTAAVVVRRRRRRARGASRK